VFHTVFSWWPAWQLCKLNFSQIASLVFPSLSNTLVCLYFSRPSIVKLFMLHYFSVSEKQCLELLYSMLGYIRFFISEFSCQMGPSFVSNCLYVFVFLFSLHPRVSPANAKCSSTSVTFPYLDTYILTLRSRKEFNVVCSYGHYWTVQCIVWLMRYDIEEWNIILGLQSFLCST
jgi:hypothetical protein